MDFTIGITVSEDIAVWSWIFEGVGERPNSINTKMDVDHFLTQMGRKYLEQLTERTNQLNRQHATQDEPIPFDVMAVMRRAKHEWKKQLVDAVEEARNN